MYSGAAHSRVQGFSFAFPGTTWNHGENNAMVALWPCVCQMIRPTKSLPALEIRISLSTIQSMPDAVAAVLAGSIGWGSPVNQHGNGKSIPSTSKGI